MGSQFPLMVPPAQLAQLVPRRTSQSPLPGEAVTATDPAPTASALCSTAELRGLFLFEKLTDAQLDWQIGRASCRERVCLYV